MKTSLHTLDNGLKVLFVDTAAFPSVTSLVLIGAGSRYETPENNGIAHFFEHMAFKGSKKYPSTFDIASAIDSFGGINNAFTSKDYTGYWIKSPVEHVEKSLDILADMILDPLLKQEDIKMESGVIIEEINMYEDNPGRDIYDIFETIMYSGSPLQMPIIGTKQTVSSFNARTFRDYIDSHYSPSNAVVILAGGLSRDGTSESEYLDIIRKLFCQWKQKDVPTPDYFSTPQTHPLIHVKEKKTEQAHFGLGFRTFSFNDDRRFALSILATILGGGMSSRLFMEVREKRGLCYYVHSYIDQYEDTGALVTNAGVSIKLPQVKEAIKITLDEHMKIKKGDMSKVEFERAKEILKGNMLLGLEDSYRVANFFGKKLLQQNSTESPEDAMKRIERVKIDEVIALAEEYFIPELLTIALIGPLKKEDLEEFESWK